MDCIKLAIKLEVILGSCNYALYLACEKGRKDLVFYSINKGANNWNWGLYGACEGGHMDLVLFMIEKGANNLNRGLVYACKDGYTDIALFLIDKGATYLTSSLLRDVDSVILSYIPQNIHN